MNASEEYYCIQIETQLFNKALKHEGEKTNIKQDNLSMKGPVSTMFHRNILHHTFFFFFFK